VNSDFRVGPWLVQPSINTISQNGTSTRVEPKVMEVLVCLSLRPGEPVSKERLLQTVWPDTFVSEDVLKRSVSELRRVFGDDPRESRIIETIPKRGYRLIGAVDSSNGRAPAKFVEAGEERPRSLSRRAPRTQRQLLLAALSTIVVVCGLLLLFNNAGLRDRLLGKRAPVINSLAVLPLQNLSGDSAQDYFADGMTEELITELSRLSTLRVISRTSVMRYRNANKPLPEIARELGVEGIVAGSVLRSGDQVRITAQLIYAPQDKNLWAQSYERDLHDVLALQSTVARSIASEIRVQMTPREQAVIISSRPVNLKAHESYLQGEYHLHLARDAGFKKGKAQLMAGEVDKALGFFQEAIEADPNYAPPYIGIWEAWQASPLPNRDWIPRAKPMVVKALQLDDTLADAHRAMAETLSSLDWDWTGAEREYQRAVQLEPSNADVHGGYSAFLFGLGRNEEAMKEAELQQVLDPKNEHMAEAFYMTRQFNRAIELYRSRAETNPGDFSPHFQLSNIYALTGNQSEAISELQKMATTLEYNELASAIGRAYKSSGYQKALKVHATQLEDVYSHTSFIPSWYIACIYSFLGDKDQAFAWLEKAYKVRDMSSLADPQWDPIRSEPRFTDLQRRMGLPQ
jgi:TolB-like protein/DNA-binding winged helix-turn-helix (wHTH) protein/Tfp pilus assembly protein PilF